MSTDVLDLGDGRRLAYHRLEGRGPGLVFLGGFRSDMTGTKASFLEDLARSRGQAFLRFDYTGHGASSGRFEDGSIGDWARDAMDVLDRLTSGPQVLIGSSMGGWIALLVARARQERLAGLIGIAAAPDFTEDDIWAAMDAETRARLERDGHLVFPSPYEEPFLITRRLIEDGRQNLVLRTPLVLPYPVRLLHGTDDRDVDFALALRLLAHAEGPDIRLTLVKDADHRFNEPEELALLARTIEEIA